mmetsp:Transcript_45056/g.143742  ORF Transcript_45056/g.143742 Transcript_45056/m.143742 type:complete len:456 (-) Transcript_45056:3345-4712(-)
MLFTALDPSVRLPLRVDHERVAGAPRHHDRVLNRELVAGQALQGPLADGALVHQKRHLLDLLMAGHLALLRVLQERLVQPFSELRVERAAVDHKGAHASDVTDQTLPSQGEVLRILGPASVLARQAREQPVRGIHLPLHGRGTVRQHLHGGLRLRQLRVQRRDLRQHRVELRLRGVEVAHGLVEASLRDLQLVHLRLDDFGRAVVHNHGAYKLAEASRGSARLAGQLWLQHLVGEGAPILDGVRVVPQVRIQQLASLVVDVVLLVGCEFQDVREEIHVLDFLAREGFVRVGEEKCGALVDRFLIECDVDNLLRHQDLQAVEGQLDDVQWLPVGLDLDNVLLRDGVAGRLRVVQEWKRLVQLDLCLRLLGVDLICLALAVRLLPIHYLGLLVRFALLDHNLVQEGHGFLLLSFEHDLLLLELYLQLFHELGGLLQLLQTDVDAPLLKIDLFVLDGV